MIWPKIITRERLPFKYKGTEDFAIGGIDDIVLNIFPDRNLPMEEAVKIPGIQFCYIFEGGNNRLIDKINAALKEYIKINGGTRVKDYSERIETIKRIIGQDLNN